ncbi:TetR family transcriptional regulator [Frankia sp. CcI49]|uniref:DNA-binding transcriptional regulator, AcrR family n=1 Tax=Parafrankia irregularis TaxID=795642 RepID=A0A0S4QWM1_9ACTN|nr:MULTISPECIES: TetR/AcrR family transcriptional regulator [Frankiaceae]KPM57409.1 TetR family transcriptional regulator [Frankia sp. R43]MBE3205175.1 TetR/AcrR family transcriptional regulator [Parafrankia sp. CH37]ONH53616.1 TetR family transcriptional regulator [Frankia sp. CcI49]CUU58870.1 DNA-binding transcriptional regulator, AcrR family [Parafrankia irregularis]
MTAEPAAPQSRPGRTPRLPRSARRFQLLGAAREVFVAHGYHAAAMDEIAERAGVSKPVLYQHFPGKLDLYLALVDEHTERLVSAVRAALASTTDNHVRVERSVRAYFDFVNDPSGAHQLVLESDLRSEPAVRQRVEDSFAQCVRAIAATIVVDTGLTQDEADLLAVGLVGQAESGARWWLQRGATIPKERAVEQLVELAWRGIAGYPRQTPYGEAGETPVETTPVEVEAAEPA